MQVVGVKNMSNGDVDIDDLKKKISKHGDQLSALMITYPSTYGKYEDRIEEIIDLIHAQGGQVYMDGANMNAQLGLTSPGKIGADVCHLNLHKTFAIPHGGGGPGVGTIGVKQHLAPYLPGHSVVAVGGEGQGVEAKQEDAVAAAPFGSAGILPIPWMFLRMLGGEGMREISSNAILNANYMANKLKPHFNIMFTRDDMCAHEFILDLRHLAKHGLSEDDVAKRLADFGFHAPTVSWPVHGTMMVEPTESESKQECDRLVDAFVMIKHEIDDVIEGRVSAQDSPLRHAPHTSQMVTQQAWDLPYTREQAAFAMDPVNGVKYWPPVSRVDSVYGDRNLMCACPTVEEMEEK